MIDSIEPGGSTLPRGRLPLRGCCGVVEPGLSAALDGGFPDGTCTLAPGGPISHAEIWDGVQHRVRVPSPGVVVPRVHTSENKQRKEHTMVAARGNRAGPTAAEVRRARTERDAVLAAVADGEEALRMRAMEEGLDAAEMALLEDLDAWDTVLHAERRSA